MNKTLRSLLVEITPTWLQGGVPGAPDVPAEPPMPAPTWKPGIEEPEPDELPDEKRDPNPDENTEPPLHAANSNHQLGQLLRYPR